MNIVTQIEQLTNKNIKDCTNQEVLTALMQFSKGEIAKKEEIVGDRKLYYISAEFLIGKLLSNNLINLGIYDKVKWELGEVGVNLAEIEDCENEPSLGNGGLGRLASCFLDSLATLGLPADGIGLCYHLGLFKQQFQNNIQSEVPNPWITETSWLEKQDCKFQVPFADFTLSGSLFDIDVVGYDNGKNKLHLFDIESVKENIVKSGIKFNKKDIKKNLTLFLYPDDSDREGHMLRIYQQYFMVSCGAQYILSEYEKTGNPLCDLHKHITIQINDTHPSLVIPELIRLLTEKGLTFEKAVDVVSNTCAYTNHTILAEALEKWEVSYFEEAIPHILPIIKKLDILARKRSRSQKVQIIDKENKIHMAHMDIHFSYSVNGVAYLHTEILKNEELNAFYKLYPEKFNNKTNGITFRRWLQYCNHDLARYIDGKIGEGWKKDASELSKLLAYSKDVQTQNDILALKDSAKEKFAWFFGTHTGIAIDTNSVFDVQIKRLHEYKRQQMNLLCGINQYFEIKKGNIPPRKITMIFGGKAAPAYIIAKDIIHAILAFANVVASDPEVSPYLQVIMLENYNVTFAENLIPAADISEQISLASKEASGTGNMKFMLNGGITLGTLDGANVEIAELVGKENIYTFGKHSKEIIKMYKKNSYSSATICEKDKNIAKIVDFLTDDIMLKFGDKSTLSRLKNEIISKDYFMTLIDLAEYINTKAQLLQDYEDRNKWAEKMIVNIGNAGFFSSDRTIAEYNREIWKLK